MGDSKRALVVNPDSCVGCMTCMLRCSYKFTGTYCPAMAAVIISNPEGDSGMFAVLFSEKCDGCGLCAAFCLYGGITRTGEGG